MNKINANFNIHSNLELLNLILLYNELMKLKNNLNTISKQTGITIADKTCYSLNKFINNLHITPAKADNFTSLVDKIQQNYINTSIKSEEYFIKNIAHTFNTKTNENLFDFSKLNLSENYIEETNFQSLIKLNTMSKNYDLVQKHFTQKNKPIKLNNYENKMIELSNSINFYKHNNNTDFIQKLDSKYGYKKLAKVKYIDYKNQDKTPVMLTFTLDKEYRKYKKVKDTILGEDTGLKQINNKNLEELIEKSYHKLNTIYRDFYQHFKVLNSRSDAKNDKLDFIIIQEPHKSLTLHLHLLYYTNTIQLNNLKKSWKHYLKSLTSKQQKAQDFKIIDTSIANASTYLSKYLVKEFNTENENEDEISFFNQYKRYFSKFKLFRTSNFYHTTQSKIDKMYSYLSANYPDILELLKSTPTPMYEILEQFEIKGLFVFEMEKLSSISFDREEIKKFYNVHKNTMVNNNETKDEIIEKINNFMSTITVSRIKSAEFIYNHSLLVEILNSYEIDMEW